jgi:predicted tellurium resistance membrane protein TerC
MCQAWAIAVLTFIGIKMLIADFYHIPVGVSLAAVASILTISILASFWKAGKTADELHPAE